MYNDFSNFLFRCSSIGHLMAEPQGNTPMGRYLDAQTKYDTMYANMPNKFNKDGVTESKIYQNWLTRYNKQKELVDQLYETRNDIELSETCKKHLAQVYIREKYGRERDISSKFIEKGLMVEEDSITLYSLVRGVYFKKNMDRINNEFITGLPDLFEGEIIHKAHTIIDIKSSWDIFTFFENQTKPTNKLYYWQLQGYMWLTGATSAKLAYCLIDTPDVFLEDEKWRLFYRMNAGTKENPDYMLACEVLEKSMRFSDLSNEEKVIEIEVERNDEDIAKIQQRVTDCRKYLIEMQDRLSIAEMA